MKSIIILISLILSLNTLHADFPETRGSILTAEGTPTKLNPVGGYIGVTKDYPSGKGKVGVQDTMT